MTNSFPDRGASRLLHATRGYRPDVGKTAGGAARLWPRGRRKRKRRETRFLEGGIR